MVMAIPCCRLEMTPDNTAAALVSSMHVVCRSAALVTGFNHFNLVADRSLLEELRGFYTAVVGLTPGPRPPFRRFGYWLYAGPQAVLHLSEASAGDVRHANPRSTFDHVAFTCTDFPAAIARLQAQGIAHHIDAVPLTGQRQIFFKDPAGNGIELNFPASQ
jgi:catechol 2,3-dioxygenase-like lactoylglutathione lyase family enzyme